MATEDLSTIFADRDNQQPRLVRRTGLTYNHASHVARFAAAGRCGLWKPIFLRPGPGAVAPPACGPAAFVAPICTSSMANYRIQSLPIVHWARKLLARWRRLGAGVLGVSWGNVDGRAVARLDMRRVSLLPGGPRESVRSWPGSLAIYFTAATREYVVADHRFCLPIPARFSDIEAKRCCCVLLPDRLSLSQACRSGEHLVGQASGLTIANPELL